jgi:predicted enzyme related to lactoylglutathione lyase
MFHTTDPGSLFWAELNTREGKRADEFFANLFGYHQQQIGDGIDVDYTTWSRGVQLILGRLQMGDDWSSDIAAHWMPHFAVDPQTGTDTAVNRVLELGGRVNLFPYDTELGRIALVTDPSGATFALIDPTARLEPITSSLAAVDDPYD